MCARARGPFQLEQRSQALAAWQQLRPRLQAAPAATRAARKKLSQRLAPLAAALAGLSRRRRYPVEAFTESTVLAMMRRCEQVGRCFEKGVLAYPLLATRVRATASRATHVRAAASRATQG